MTHPLARVIADANGVVLIASRRHAGLVELSGPAKRPPQLMLDEDPRIML